MKQDIVDKLRGVGGIESGILYSRRSMLNEAANTIESIRSRAENAEAELLTMTRKFNGAVGLKDQQRMRAETAEATCERLAAALKAIADYYDDYFYEGEKEYQGVIIARQALSEYRKEAPDAA